MAHLQYMPGDPRLVDQLVYELKSKGIFDQFRKDCIADVDTRPAYQNLRQRVESSVCAFLSRQVWKPDLNKNQLREKLRKHILDGNYLEQGVERIVDQVVNPKVASVFIPQVEDLVYNYLGIPRKKAPKPEATEAVEDLLPTDLEAVSPGSVKSNDEKMEVEHNVEDMDIDSEGKTESIEMVEKTDLIEVSSDSASMDKSSIPLPAQEINLEDIPAPDNSPKPTKIELENIELPREPNLSTDIPLPNETPQGNHFFKPIALHGEDSNSSTGSSLRRNMSPITPVRNFDDENSCDAQQGFENDSDGKDNDEKLSNFRFNIETKEEKAIELKKIKNEEQLLSYRFTNQVNLNMYNTPMYDDSSNSHNLQIDYESDASKTNHEVTLKEVDNLEDAKKEKQDGKKSHKSSHRSRDSSRHSSSKDGHASIRDSKHDKKSSSSKDDKKSSKEREKPKDGEKKDRESSHSSSHKSSSKDKHRSSSSSHRHASKSSDERKSSKDKERSSEKDKDRSSDNSSRKDSKSSHRDKDRKSSKKDDKEKKKDKKDIDDHYSSSGRGKHTRRSTDRDSNDGSSSSKGSQNQSSSKSADSKKDSKNGSKDSTSTSGESTSSPSDKEQVMDKIMQFKPIVRVDNHLETPIANPPRLPFVPDVTLKKPKFAANFEEAKKMMKMRRFLAEEQKRMNQEAALLLEFQANVRPSLSQVYSSIPGPELEFACVTHTGEVKEENTEVKTDNKEHKTNEIKVEDTCKDNIQMEVSHDKTIETDNLVQTDSIEQKLAIIVQSGEETKQMTKETIDMINEVIGVTLNEVDIDKKNDIVESFDADIPKTETKVLEKVNYEENKTVSDLVSEIGEYIKATDKSNDSIEASLVEEEMSKIHAEFEVAIPTETCKTEMEEIIRKSENELQYFGECDKFNAEIECQNFSIFFKEYIEKCCTSNKMYLINCDTYEENIVKEVASTFGDFEIVNYYKNGHLVPNTSKSVVNIPLTSEISLPIEPNYDERANLFSPVKSECSFELSSDYDAKLDEILNKKSRQEVMEIILGGIIDESTCRMPTIDYTEDTDISKVDEYEQTSTSTTDDKGFKIVEVIATESLKRRADETFNNNRLVLTPNKIRRMSDSDQISSTTEETEEVSNNNKLRHPSARARSKYRGRAKRAALPNSPSSDKSVENYAHISAHVNHTRGASHGNGKLKCTRTKVQRYDPSDLYKPKLHYLSRRNIS